MAKHKQVLSKKAVAKRKSSLKSAKSSTNKRRVMFALIFGLVGTYFIIQSFAAPPAPSVPFNIKEERFNDLNNRGGCVSEDDQLIISGNNGYLAPGQSFSYTTKTPDCENNARVIHMFVNWAPKSSRNAPKLELTATVAAHERWLGWTPTYYATENHIGQIIFGQAQVPTFNVKNAAGQSALCMFSSFRDPTNYTFTIKNVSTVTATNIYFLSQDQNDWPDYFLASDNCASTDADRDGFSDGFEHYKAMFSEGGRGGTDWAPPPGLNYLKACGTATPNDEFDYWAPDMNDDNTVNQTDINIIQSFVGKGDGRNWFHINEWAGAYPQPESGPWLRYDMNIDGYVTDADVAIIKGYLGKTCGV
jgi:hypothetical protein